MFLRKNVFLAILASIACININADPQTPGTFSKIWHSRPAIGARGTLATVTGVSLIYAGKSMYHVSCNMADSIPVPDNGNAGMTGAALVIKTAVGLPLAMFGTAGGFAIGTLGALSLIYGLRQFHRLMPKNYWKRIPKK